MASVFLKNQYPNSIQEMKYYFYDGETVVRYGVIEIDASRPEWVRRAYIEGYSLDPASGKALAWADVERLTESAKSAGDDVEGPDTGGQPSSEDWLREGEQPRDASVPQGGVDSSVSPRAAKRAPRN